MTPAEREATAAIRHKLQSGQARIWQNDIDSAIRILFDALVPESKGAPLSCLHRVIERTNVLTRAAAEQLVSTVPQSLTKLAMINVECASLSDDVLIAQILDPDNYIYSDQVSRRPMPDDVGPSHGQYRDGYSTINTLLKLLRVYAILSKHPKFLGKSEEELSIIAKRVDPILSSIADPRASLHDTATKTALN